MACTYGEELPVLSMVTCLCPGGITPAETTWGLHLLAGTVCDTNNLGSIDARVLAAALGQQAHVHVRVRVHNCVRARTPPPNGLQTKSGLYQVHWE
jgi:hypothetical protein